MKATESSTAQNLGIHVRESEGGVLVSLSGRVTIDSSPHLRKQLLTLLSRPAVPNLTVDLAEASYVDCSGIATLIEALRTAHQRHGKLTLRGVRDAPRHLLEVTGLLGLFDPDGGTDGSAPLKVG